MTTTFLIRLLLLLASAIVGYLTGCINPAYLVAKAKGFDIRTKGSHNPGTSNATITMGWKIGIFVGFCDILKGFLPTFAFVLLAPEMPLAAYIAGTFCVIGHMYSVFMRFHGGKGFATFLGVIIALHWPFFILAEIATILITLITDYITLATLTVAIAYPVFLFVVGVDPIPASLISLVSLIMVIKHRQNLLRIIRGEEIGLRNHQKYRISKEDRPD